ncbi:retroviral-like aspartic protease family protein [Telluria aromaticivorans]|uniref:Peptidase A2 domain-containing protein n=1 Tax=Telluria aromaticivorans TaxID=2725995 RepID=A0A7Y2NZ97_9BURK|nr:retroviral-like aspartic protease family protein [Telluria aromaticivorans]NNG21584.1 hypothetical protein [Telluria aromaticivorans]
MNTPLPARVARRPGFAMLAALLLPAAVSAQALPAGCDIGPVATLPLSFRGDSVPIAEARINGKPVPALVDTGGQHATLLDKATLESAGIKVISSETNYAGVYVLNALIEHIAIGPTEFKKSWFAVDDLAKEEVGARIGANYLFRTDVEFALQDRYLKFYKPSGCLRAPLAYWDKTAPSVSFRIHPQKKDLRPFFTVRINGADVSAVISTTTEHSYLDLFTAKRMGLTPDSPGAVRGGSGLKWNDRDQAFWTVPLPQLSIGALQVKDFSLRLVNMERSGEMLVLGTDFLKRHRIYVAMSQNRIYFSPVTAPAPDAQAATAAP